VHCPEHRKIADVVQLDYMYCQIVSTVSAKKASDITWQMKFSNIIYSYVFQGHLYITKGHIAQYLRNDGIGTELSYSPLVLQNR